MPILTTTRDRALVDLILDWAHLFYYRARLVDLGDLLDAHQDSVQRLDDETKRMWWLIWRGHADGCKLDQAGNVVHLDQAIEIALRIGNETGYVYARTWQVWAHFVAGRPREAIEAARSIEKWVVDHRDVDPYPFFKSRCILVFALSYAGQVEGVESMCADLVEFGHKVGNNRCIAFGLQALAMMHLTLGNYQRATALAGEASSTAKDPMYRDTAQLTAIGAATLSGDFETARASVAHLRAVTASGIQLPAPIFADFGESLVMLTDGELSEGMALLEKSIELAADTSRGWEWIYGRSVKAVVMARIASGEMTGDFKSLLRNPRFVSYLRKARMNAGSELSALRDDALARGLDMIANICDVEQAKLLMSRGENTEARLLLERSLAFSDRSQESEGANRVRELLART